MQYLQATAGAVGSNNLRAMRRNPAKFFNASIDTNRKTKYTSHTGSKVQPDGQISKGL